MLTARFMPPLALAGAPLPPCRHSSLTVLDNVASHRGWQPRHRGGSAGVKAPHPGSLSVTALHDPLLSQDSLTDAYLLNASDFLQPDSLQLGRTGSDQRELLKSRPEFFDATGMRVEQRFAASKDGTRVPYFVIWPKGAAANGRNPTLLYGYGGLSSRSPGTRAPSAALDQQGGVFVLATSAAAASSPRLAPGRRQAGKQRATTTLPRSPRTLINNKLTRPAAGHPGRQQRRPAGRRGDAPTARAVRRRRLPGAAARLQRYHKRWAGACGMAEYGDPDKADEWATIAATAVPQRQARRPLPRVLFTTSTRDDRATRPRTQDGRPHGEQGHDVLYWKTSKGPRRRADNGQLAR